MVRFTVAGAVLLVMLISVAACATSSSSSPIEDTLRIPNGFGMGGDDDGILVTFLEVFNDSRCAEGVTCVRAGEAFVRLGITVDDRPEEEVTIEFASGTEPLHRADRFEITLLQLQPDPPPVGGVEQSDYRLRVRIQER